MLELWVLGVIQSALGLATTRQASAITRSLVFIGSSSEGKAFARAAREALDQDADIVLWDEGFADLGRAFIETLVNKASDFDFAILILTPDDAVTTRDVVSPMPRDNVIFELGLFMGTLGRSRTFLLTPSVELKMPTDLSGVTTATFRWPRDSVTHLSAIGAACDKIRREIHRQGPRTGHTELEERVGESEKQLAAFEERLLTQILPFLIPPSVLTHLEALDKNERGLPNAAAQYYGNELVRGQLRTLRDLGLVEVAPPHSHIADVPDGPFDLSAYVRLTEPGRGWTGRAQESRKAQASPTP